MPKSVGMNNETYISMQRVQGGGNYRFVSYVSLFTLFTCLLVLFIFNCRNLND